MIVPGLRFHLWKRLGPQVSLQDLGSRVSDLSLGSRVSLSDSQLWDWTFVLGLWPYQKSLVSCPIFWVCLFYSKYFVHPTFFLQHISRLRKLRFIIFPVTRKRDDVSTIFWKVIEIYLERPFSTNAYPMDTSISYNKYDCFYIIRIYSKKYLWGDRLVYFLVLTQKVNYCTNRTLV